MPTRNSKANGQQPAIDVGNITRADLTDDRRFVQIYREFVRRRWWPNDHPNFLEFASYAVKALDEDKLDTPGRLFASLIKHNERRITQDQEDRAMFRFPSGRIGVIVQWVRDTATDSTALTPREPPTPAPIAGRQIGYLPAAAVQCFLPQKQLPDGELNWDMSHGNTALRITAGQVPNRDNKDEWRQCAVPYGYLPRLLLPYVIGQAVKSRSRTVEMGRSLRSFLKQFDISVDGRVGKRLTAAVEDLASASFMLGYWDDDGSVHASYERIARSVHFWIEPDERQRTFWMPEIELSHGFYEQIQEHRVPVDIAHLIQLTRSPRRMDLYTWLAHRTAAIPPRGRVTIPLHDFQRLFALDISEFRLFKQRLKADLKAIANVWPRFRAEILGDMLILRHSDSPVPHRSQIASR